MDMIKAPVSEREQERIKALNELEILDSEAEKVFDDLTQLASEICGTPISLISLVDPDRQWFKSKIGIDAEETHRDIAFCSHAILQEELFEIPNALEDERFHDNPLVTSDPNIRFYAGTQLQTPEGHNIGTLCVIDREPKRLSQHQKNALEILGREVMSQLDLRIRNKKLKDASRYKSEYLANMSHELRTPLNAIVGLSELSLRHQQFTQIDEEIQAHLSQIHASGKTLLGVINAVLDLSKIEAAKMELNETSCFLPQLVERTIEVLAYRAELAEVVLELNIAADAELAVILDEQKVSQILINIINNAIKFTPKGKKIVVSIWTYDKQIHIQVEDQGVGISPENLAFLFDKYAQVGKLKNAQEGTGLGLTITKGLLELMSGSIEIDSTEGEGTRVLAKIPLNKSYLSHSQPHPQCEQADLKRRKALVVEDDGVNQAVISAMLNKLEVEFELCDEGEKALDTLAQKEFDFVLMDINLPGISGVEVTRRFKNDGGTTPVIALTADVFRTNREKSLFDGFLTKPVQLKGLESELLSNLSC